MKLPSTSVPLYPENSSRAGTMSAASILAHKSAKAFYEAEKDNPDFNFYNEGEQREEALKAIYAEAAKMQAAYDKAVAAQTAKESDKPDAGKGKSADDKK